MSTLYVSCPLCGADVGFSVSRAYPATYWSPAEGGDIEDIEPACECANARCVKPGTYYEMIEELARDKVSNYDPMDAYDGPDRLEEQ